MHGSLELHQLTPMGCVLLEEPICFKVEQRIQIDEQQTSVATWAHIGNAPNATLPAHKGLTHDPSVEHDGSHW